jgi:hypothetical protein
VLHYSPPKSRKPVEARPHEPGTVRYAAVFVAAVAAFLMPHLLI